VEQNMATKGKRFKAEQIVNMLREIDVITANGKSLTVACKQVSISEQTYYRWRKIYGGLKVDQAKRLKEIEAENSKLKKLVADLSLREAMLKEVVKGNF
jgi:putative transposase